MCWDQILAVVLTEQGIDLSFWHIYLPKQHRKNSIITWHHGEGVTCWAQVKSTAEVVMTGLTGRWVCKKSICIKDWKVGNFPCVCTADSLGSALVRELGSHKPHSTVPPTPQKKTEKSLKTKQTLKETTRSYKLGAVLKSLAFREKERFCTYEGYWDIPKSKCLLYSVFSFLECKGLLQLNLKKLFHGGYWGKCTQSREYT